jgi:hypothetical protein
VCSLLNQTGGSTHSYRPRWSSICQALQALAQSLEFVLPPTARLAPHYLDSADVTSALDASDRIHRSLVLSQNACAETHAS